MTSDIAIVGGGVVGCAIAHMLAKENVRVTLIEASKIGKAGATFYSGGILRAFERDLAAARMACLGVAAFHNWEALGFRGACGYRQVGAVFLPAPDDADSARRLVDALTSDGYPMEFVEAGDVARRFPLLTPQPWGGAIYEPYGGFADVRLTARSLLAEVSSHCHLIVEEPVRRIVRESASCVIELANRKIRAQRVIVAAGAMSSTILSESGIPLSESRQIRARSIGVPSLVMDQRMESYRFPHVVVDEWHQSFLRPLDRDSYMVGANLDKWLEGDLVPPALGDEHFSDALRRGAQMIRCLENARADGGVNGYDGYTDQRRPIVGVIPAMPEVYLASGFSGRGYKVVLPLAAAVARDVLGGISPSTANLCPLDVFEGYRILPS